VAEPEHHEPHQSLELTVVVNGQSTEVRAEPGQPLGSIIPRALEQTGNAGQPADSWELRSAQGEVLPLDKHIKDFHFGEDTTLFLNLKAGIGG
jgi:hypothetical protein